MAELVEVAEPTSRRPLDFALAATVAVSIVFIILTSTLTSHTTSDLNSGAESVNWWEVPIQDRWQMDLVNNSSRSQLPIKNKFEILPMTEHYVEVELPPEEQDAGFPEQAKMHLSLWLP